ncbi:DNA polymerase domain-containing protein [Lentisphaerota bacterium WC36G]|nr:DNA polymerase II [Lentisphaerae bacterium WC36]
MNLDKLINSKFDCVVAAEPLNDGSALLYIRDVQGQKIIEKEIEFKPYLLLNDEALLNGVELEVSFKNLNGAGKFNVIAEFRNKKEYDEAVKFLKTTTKYNPSSLNAPYKVFSDMQQQLLTSQEIRLFRNLKFTDLHRVQFDIEVMTTDGFDFPSATRVGDEIIIITVSDNFGFKKIIHQDENSDERAIIKEFVDTIQKLDPDVLEGHNIFNFDLPYLETRAKKYRVKMALGRDKSVIKKRASRFNAAERTINYTRYDVFGRAFVDTFHLAIFYDMINRNLEGFGLKYLAKHFNVASADRTYVAGEEITVMWNDDERREILLAYALDDVLEVNAISEILLPSYFYQAQIIPFKFQDCVIRGNAMRIEALLVGEYLTRSQALPFASGEVFRFTGGLTESFEVGVFDNVWHCDVRSLYPSIIVANSMNPANDSLGLFNEFLTTLRDFRLSAKDAQSNAEDVSTKDFYQALQSSFKILINSFYGYLGFSMGTFCDFNLAENVTASGREILVTMKDFLSSQSAQLLEMDTDGIYFCPPENVTDTEAFQKLIQKKLPKGIEVDLDSTYQAMLCYKSKNYALLENNDEVVMRGAALKSRGLEPFLRNYIEEVVTLLLNKKVAEAVALQAVYEEKISNYELPLLKFAKKETLNDSLENYQKKMASGKGRRSAVYELAIESERKYERGDQVSYYVIGDKKKVPVVGNSKLLADNNGNERDENVNYYLGKLSDTVKKFKDFLIDDEPSLF